MRRLASLAAAAALAGCAVGTDYARPDLPIPEAYPAAQAGSEAALPAEWWRLYGDATLDGLVSDAFARNSEMAIAIARVAEAEANLREAGATIFPEVDGSIGAARSRVSASTSIPAVAPLVRNDVHLGLSTSFELDFWGRLRRGREAAQALAEASRNGRDLVRLSIAGLVAQQYFAVRSLDAQVRLARGTLAARSGSLGVARSRLEAGLASDLDVNQARLAVADAAILARDLGRQRELAEHQLALLTGRLDLRVPPVESPLPALPALPSSGLPSALLDRRPDVRQAEEQLAAANAQVGVAKAAYFPTISLSASGGGQSTALASILESPARVWSVGVNAVAPVLDWGRTTARVDAAAARRDQALATYRRVAAIAYREVADALTEVNRYRDVQQDLEERARIARNTLDLVGTRYRSGYSAYLEVLDAQRTLNDAEQSVARNRLALLNASVNLMKALGGGWAPGSA